MYTQAISFAILLAFVEARFAQEQIPIPAISALTAGAPGVAQTLAGSSVSTLLAAANPCAKVSFDILLIESACANTLIAPSCR